ncbi:hypothetical protein RUND412_011247 [Rhizina undulata]
MSTSNGGGGGYGYSGGAYGPYGGYHQSTRWAQGGAGGGGGGMASSGVGSIRGAVVGGVNMLGGPPSTPSRAVHDYSNFEIAVPVNRWSSHPTPTTPTAAPMSSNPSDPHVLLLALAESYFEAAHATGVCAILANAADVTAYYKLVATGLKCLETVLQWRLQPRVEAMVRLRYASILHEETDNVDEAEEALNKANNLVDLRPSMHHLLARIMFQTSPKASIKMLGTYTTECDELENYFLMYSYRFLRCTLLMSDSPSRDDLAALNTVQKISNISAARLDYNIYTLSNLMEAMITLLPGADGVEAAQRALAKANENQSNPMAPKLPQLEVLSQILDIICSVMLGNYPQSEGKVKILHGMLDQKERWATWRDDGEFEVEVNRSRQGRAPEQLRFKWLSKNDVFVLGYFLSGVCKFQKNVDEGGKAEKFLMEGLKTLDRLIDPNQQISCSIIAAANKQAWRKTLKCYMHVYHAFLLCIRTDWDKAIKEFKALQDASSQLQLQNTPLHAIIVYLHATISQGTNNLPLALSLYEKLYTTISADSELSIMARLNSILILRSRDPRATDALLASVEKACMASKNKLIKSAFMTVKATERGELVKTKNYLSMALQLASQATNQQLTYVILSFMCHRFFTGVVSEQAEKSSRAALLNAKKGRDDLWTLMGGEMYADCLARKGSELDAERQREINKEARSKVIENLTRSHHEIG